MFDSVVELLRKAEGRDKLTKLIIYLLKFTDALISLIQRYPTYRMEKIASNLFFIQYTSNARASSCV